MERKSFDLDRGQGIEDIKLSNDYNNRLLTKIKESSNLKAIGKEEINTSKISPFIFKDRIAGLSFLLSGFALIVMNAYGLNLSIERFLFQATRFFNGMIHFTS